MILFWSHSVVLSPSFGINITGQQRFKIPTLNHTVITFYKIVAYPNFESYRRSLSVALVLELGLGLESTVSVEISFW